MIISLKKTTNTEEAEIYAREMHTGQYRKVSCEEYIAHPERVVKLAKSYGVKDNVSIAITWLHDVVEDTDATIEDIRKMFGDKVAYGVEKLTIGNDYEKYKSGIISASNNIQMIKLCDTLDNVKTLHELTNFGIERKVYDCFSLYIPMANKICPAIGKELNNYVHAYKNIAA